MQPTVETEHCRLYLADCRDVLPTLQGVDAVVTDPPYHGVKSDEWDNQWKTDTDFLTFVFGICELFAGALSSNASLYWFASPQMAGRVEVEIAKRFRVLNNLVWCKGDSRGGVGGTGIDLSSLRRFWSASSERIIFAEQYVTDERADDASGYTSQCETTKRTIIGDYLASEIKRSGASHREVTALFPSITGGMTGWLHNKLSGLQLPTKEQYHAIRDFLNGRNCKTDYLRREYEDLRREYEDLRRPFNVTARDEWGDVWRFKIERDQVHPTQKPLALMRHIVKTSSRTGTTILDPFMGSGTTGVACIRTGRKFIGIEKDGKYFSIAVKRIEEAEGIGGLFENVGKAQVPELFADV